MRESLKDFFEVYEFYKKTGIWTSTAVYGIMNVAYKEMYGEKAKIKTGCSGCITKAAEDIYNKWH